MHNNYYFLKQLTVRLREELADTVFVHCFSQNKDELILIFDKVEHPFIIKAYLSANFCCISFPTEFHRARKNSVDLFNEVIGHKVVGIYQFLNERAFAVELEDGYSLIFKLHGNRSNVLLVKHENVRDLFHNKLIKDLQILPAKLDRPIDQSFEAFEAALSINDVFPTFNQSITNHLKHLGYEDRNKADQWILIQETLNTLNRGEYHVTHKSLSLIPLEDSIKFNDPIEAINEFFKLFISNVHLNSEKKRFLQAYKTKLKRGKNYITKTANKLNELKSGVNYKIFGDLLMANLHQIPQNSSNVELMNFYDENRLIEIPLKKSLSPQKNAEWYYKKSKNQSIELNQLQSNIEAKTKELAEIENHLIEIEATSNHKSLKEYIKKHSLEKQTQTSTINLPYNIVTEGDFVIWIGKNAKSNDQMLKLTYKEDLWLHAKDVTGSHVIIKHQSGLKTPMHIKEKAASIAAFYSKRKTDTLCPVIVTPRKFVRKRKGDPPGAVVVDKEQEVLLVTPSK